MYQVMIADDEGLILETLKNMVDWNSFGYEVVGCFRDGSELLEALEYTQVDVIFTDIKMSHVSGLDIAKFVYEKMPYCKVVVISGYQEFQLAVEAMQYGVVEYVVKPLEISNIEKILEKVSKLLYEQRKDLHVQKEMEEKLEQMNGIMKEKLFEGLVFGDNVNLERTRKYLEVLYPNNTFEQNSCFFCEFRIIDYKRFIEEQWMYSREQLENNLRNFFQVYNYGMIAHLIYKSHETLGIFGINISDSDSSLRTNQQLLEHLREELENVFHMKSTYSIKKEYHTLQDMAEKNNEQILFRLSEQENMVLLNEYKKKILSNISEGNMNVAQHMIHGVFGELEENDLKFMKKFISDLFIDMVFILKNTNAEMAEELHKSINYQSIFHLENSLQLKNFTMRILDRIKLKGTPKLNNNPESFVEMAKTYVNDNITKDISREDVADALYICSTYLSRIFKQQTGETFSQYITKMKVNKAIELLKNPKYKVYEVCDFLGYKTPRYFSNVFKNHTGMNPIEYRRAVLHLEVVDDEKL